IGASLTELLMSPEQRAEAAAAMARVRSGQSVEGEFRILRKDGSSVLCLVRDSPINDAGGRVVGTVSITVDVTDRERQERLIAARTGVTRALSQASSLDDAA